jgi:hypothetical protein
VYAPQQSSSDLYLYYVLASNGSTVGSIFLRHQGAVYPVAEGLKNVISIQLDSNQTYLYASYGYNNGYALGLLRIALNQSNLRHAQIENLTDISLGRFGLVSDSFIISGYVTSSYFLTSLNLTTKNTSYVQYGYGGTAVGWSLCGNTNVEWTGKVEWNAHEPYEQYKRFVSLFYTST